MSTVNPRFIDYGDDADLAGARRSRKAFRFIVTAVILLTFFMWYAEQELRHSQAENNYRTGVTHRRDAARVFLQSAIKIDAETGEPPTAKYTQALAVRQEDDIALDTFATAWQMDSTSSLFGLRYGSREFQIGQPAKATELFRESAQLPPDNALPHYLEAAAIARGGARTTSLQEAVVVVSRANNANQEIVFPRPLWFSGYPESGSQYALLAREISVEICAPLYALAAEVVRSVEQQIESGQTHAARSWLLQLDTMGERLVSNAEPLGTLQAIAGITIQQQVAKALEDLHNREGYEADEALIEKRVKLSQAAEVLQEFETTRDERITAIEREFRLPLTLSFLSITLIVGCYLLAMTCHKLLRLRKSAWALPHSTLGKWMLGFGATAVFLLLQTMATLQKIPEAQTETLRMVSTLWWTVIGVLVGFGCIYPLLTLTSPEEVARKSGRPEEMPNTTRLARQAYRRVYAAMVVRYYGILSGLSIGTLCVWLVIYRIANGLYPWQVNLLADGLLNEEIEVVRRALALLA